MPAPLDRAEILRVAALLRPVPARARREICRREGISDRLREAARGLLAAEEVAVPGPTPPAPPASPRAAPPASTPLLASDLALLGALRGGPLATRDLRAALPLYERTLTRARTRLRRLGLIEQRGEGSGATWALTPSGLAAPTEPPASTSPARPSPRVAPRVAVGVDERQVRALERIAAALEVLAGRATGASPGASTPGEA